MIRRYSRVEVDGICELGAGESEVEDDQYGRSDEGHEKAGL